MLSATIPLQYGKSVSALSVNVMVNSMYGFTIEELLVGKYYRTSNARYLDGIIVEANKREVSNADNAYSIRVRQQQSPWSEFWATVCIDEV